MVWVFCFSKRWNSGSLRAVPDFASAGHSRWKWLRLLGKFLQFYLEIYFVKNIFQCSVCCFESMSLANSSNMFYLSINHRRFTSRYRKEKKEIRETQDSYFGTRECYFCRLFEFLKLARPSILSRFPLSLCSRSIHNAPLLFLAVPQTAV